VLHECGFRLQIEGRLRAPFAAFNKPLLACATLSALPEFKRKFSRLTNATRGDRKANSQRIYAKYTL
jgi:hypothetical protein